jgi:predicted secreted protein
MKYKQMRLICIALLCIFFVQTGKAKCSIDPAKCWFTDLINKLEDPLVSDEFKKFMLQEDTDWDIYFVVYETYTATSVQELTNVNTLQIVKEHLAEHKDKTSKSLIAEIKGAGGYDTWKKKVINNTGDNLPTKLVEGKNIFRASSQEYSLAKKIFKEYRKGVIYEQSKILSKDDLTAFKIEFNKRNLGSIKGRIDHEIYNEEVKLSGRKYTGEPIFNAYKVDEEGNIDVDGAWSREKDIEYVMLSEIAKSKGAVKGGVYPKVTGEIIISSEFPYCVSCQGVIQDFSNMFPKVNVILIDKIRWKKKE